MWLCAEDHVALTIYATPFTPQESGNPRHKSVKLVKNLLIVLGNENTISKTCSPLLHWLLQKSKC